MKSNTFELAREPICRMLLLLGFCISLLSDAAAESRQNEFTKSINREFATTADGMTALYNKYGKVNVNTWANNSVKINITILVNAGDQRSADKMFDRIKVNFTSTAGYIKAETVVEQNNSWWPVESTCGDFKINYEVWMPAKNQLDLKNKYGNSYVSTLNGKLTAEIRYGDLRTEAIYADADLSIGYGKANMAKVQNLYGQVSYGGLTLGEAGNVQMETKNSDFEITRADVVRITSTQDNFIFGTVDDLRLQTKYSSLKLQNAQSMYVTAQYTDVVISNISAILDVDLSYGSLGIESLGRNFTNANINAKYTDVQVNTERGASYRFDAEVKSSDLRYPKSATIRHHDDTGSNESVQGYVGDANAKGVVKARLNYGGFVLK